MFRGVRCVSEKSSLGTFGGDIRDKGLINWVVSSAFRGMVVMPKPFMQVP